MLNDLIVNTLSTLGYPVLLHGSIAPDAEYPDTFITFQTLESDTEHSFDNEEAITSYQIATSIYTRDPSLLSTLPDEVRALMKQADFIPQGRGYDLLSNEPDFVGWIIYYYYLKKEGYFNG